MGTAVNNFFNTALTADLLGRDFVQQAVLAAALLALLGGLIGPFIVMRQMSFAVHGSSELSLTGAAFALLTGLNVGLGALVGSALAAILFGILGQRSRERDSAIGVVLGVAIGTIVDRIISARQRRALRDAHETEASEASGA